MHQHHLRDLIARIAADSAIHKGQRHDAAARRILDGDQAPCFSLEMTWRSLVPRFPTRAAAESVLLIPEYIAHDIAATMDAAFGAEDEDDVAAVILAETARQGDADEAAIRVLAHPSSVGEMQDALDRMILHRLAMQRVERMLSRRLVQANQGKAA